MKLPHNCFKKIHSCLSELASKSGCFKVISNFITEIFQETEDAASKISWIDHYVHISIYEHSSCMIKIIYPYGESFNGQRLNPECVYGKDNICWRINFHKRLIFLQSTL